MKSHIAKRRFGQNFLTDPSVIQQLMLAINPAPSQLMVEIGPGLGALTQPLLQKMERLHVVEIDRDIVEWMQSEYAKPAYATCQLIVHHVDALKFDFSTLLPISSAFSADARRLDVGSQVVHKVKFEDENDAHTADAPKPKKLRVTGNLPYNISTPILFHLLDSAQHIEDMHFMLQKEVVERMVAAPSTPAYGRLSVMLQYALQMDYLFTVPPEAFDPAPKVDSAFVRCKPYATPPYLAKDTVLFSKIVLAAFSQRRKTIRNTLKAYLSDSNFAALGLNPTLRAENLSVAQFVTIANHLSH